MRSLKSSMMLILIWYHSWSDFLNWRREWYGKRWGSAAVVSYIFKYVYQIASNSPTGEVELPLSGSIQRWRYWPILLGTCSLLRTSLTIAHISAKSEFW